MMSVPLIVFVAAYLAMWPSVTVGLRSKGREPQQPVSEPLAFQQPVQQLQHEQAWPFQDDLQLPEQPMSALPNEQLANSQMSYAENVPGFMREQQSFLGCSGQNPGFFRRSVGSPISMQESSSEGQVIMQPSLQRTVLALQAQLAAERSNEVQLANVASARQQEMTVMNASFTRILTLAEKGADQERQLQEQLAQQTASNEALQGQLSKVRSEESEKVKEVLAEKAEVAKLQKTVAGAEERASQSELMQKRTLHDSLRIMKDVQAAQLKVQRAEDMIRKLLPRLKGAATASATSAADAHMSNRV